MPRFIKDNLNDLKEGIEVKPLQKEVNVFSSDYFPPLEDQMRQKEVAVMFQKTIQTVCAWTKANKIPYFRLGSRPIYSKKQLILYASRNQHLISNK